MTGQPQAYTAEEWQTIQALRQMPPNDVYDVAAQQLEYLIAARTGERIESVALSDDTRLFIDELVRSGRFNTRGEVVADAVAAFMRNNPIPPLPTESTESTEPAEHVAGCGCREEDFVLEATTSLQAFALRLLELLRSRPEASTPVFLQIGDDRVELTPVLVAALYAIVEPLSLREDVTIRAVRPEADSPAG